MSTEPSKRKTLVLPDAMWAEIAAYRHGHHISSEAEALRRLIRAGLDGERAGIPRADRGESK